MYFYFWRKTRAIQCDQRAGAGGRRSVDARPLLGKLSRFDYVRGRKTSARGNARGRWISIARGRSGKSDYRAHKNVDREFAGESHRRGDSGGRVRENF